MYNIICLVRVQMGTVLVDMLSLGNNRKRKPKALYAGLVLFALVMGSVAFFYSLMIGKGLLMFDSIELLPALMMAVTSIVVLFTTAFKVKGTIFGFKDYDMVMSLPVSTGGIVASRLILLYSLNMVFVCIVMIPMMIAYSILAKPDILFYAFGLILMLALPLIPIVIASIFGTIIAYAASKFRYSSLVSIVVSFGLLLAIMGISFMTGDTGRELVDISKALTNKVNAIYPLANLYSLAISNYDIMALFTFLAISLLGFLLYSILVGKVFKKVNTLIMTGKSRSNYRIGELRQSSPIKALYNKEIRRYFSSPIYVLNTGFGIVMLTIAAIALIFVDLEKLTGDPQLALLIKNSGPVFIAFCLSTTCTTAASISMEGKSLWIIKSLPISAKSIFISKIAVNLSVAAPALLDALIIGIILKYDLIQIFYLITTTIVIAIFISLLGLVVNLKFPNFNWTTEAIVVKQSASSMIAAFSGMGIAGILFLLVTVIPSANLPYLIFLGLMVIANIALYRILITWGSKQFTKLY